MPPPQGPISATVAGASPSPSSPLPPAPQPKSQLQNGFVVLSLLLIVAAFLFLAHTHRFGDVAGFRAGLRSVSTLPILFGLLSIHLGLVIRAFRWSLLRSPPHSAEGDVQRRPRSRDLVAPQFAGFAAVSLFGRVADLTRPYLIARRTGTPLALQVGVYSVERALDVAATAVLFSVTLLFVPAGNPHHRAFSRAGLVASLATLCMFATALLLRNAGDRLAAFTAAQAGRFSPNAARRASARVLELQAGFSTLRSWPQFLGAFAWSLVIWFGIALSYLLTAHSVRSTPALTSLGLASILLVMATSMGTSLLQLPVLGWLTQVAALTAAYHGYFGVPPAAASLCALLTFAVNTLSVIPVGLIFAHFSDLPLRQAGPSSPQDQALNSVS